LSDVPSPVFYRGVLYVVKDGGILTSFDPHRGEVRNQIRLTAAVDKYFASPVAGDGKLYLIGQSGKIAIVRTGPEPELLSVHDLDEECYATPAIAHQGIYIRTREALYRYSTSSPRAHTCRADMDACGAGYNARTIADQSHLHSRIRIHEQILPVS
jgi:hypothetical protein